MPFNSKSSSRRPLLRVSTLIMLCILVGSWQDRIIVHAQEDEEEQQQQQQQQQTSNSLQDTEEEELLRRGMMVHHLDPIEDSFLDPLQADPSCTGDGGSEEDCFSPPQSTVETETILDATCFKGGKDYSDDYEDGSTVKEGGEEGNVCVPHERTVDKHWGDDEQLQAMRDQLRQQALTPLDDKRPPIFLLPGLASTRLVAWKLKTCKGGVFDTKIKVQDNVWLNINLILQMGTINVQCMSECLRLGLNQSDTDDWEVGCKLRPDEGLDAIASLAPGGIGSSLLVGGTNTVYSWLIQWLADNLGYDVTNIVGLPYDWRLSPDKMEARDGFLSMTRRRIEAAVASNGHAGIMVAHSMGNLVFRYFLEWLRVEMREEAYQEYVTRARRREERRKKAEHKRASEEQMRQHHRDEQQKQHIQQVQDQLQEQQGEMDTTTTITNPPPNVEQVAVSETLNNNESPSSILPGWVTAAVPGLDGVLGWVSSLSQGESGGVEGPDQAAANNENAASLDALRDELDGLHDHTTTPPEVLSSSKTSENDQRRREEADTAATSGISEEEEELRDAQFRELAIEEGDAKWLEWLEKHIWTYIGLSSPLLGAVNPLRSVLSGENMGLPISDENARHMEVTFGSTHTLNPVSIATGFCDQWDTDDWAEDNDESSEESRAGHAHRLACLDDIMNDIEYSSVHRDPWKNFPALKAILRDRMDWDTNKPMIDIQVELCQKKDSGGSNKGNGKKSCIEKETVKFGPKDVENGHIFDVFDSLWKEEGNPLIIKREQLEESFINTKVKNMLNTTWERPPIKHVVMAYGVDIPTEVGYIYKKNIDVDSDLSQDSNNHNKTGGMPNLKAVLWEEPNGNIMVEPMATARGSLTEHFMKKKTKKVPFKQSGEQSSGHGPHSGDGSVPYLSLSWVHTWLLHAARARRFGEENGQQLPPVKDRKNVLDHISISHRPHGAIEWVNGPPPEETEILYPAKMVDTGETGVDHPHGTRYKPLMTRYHNVGTSRTTGTEYTTTVIEAVGVEHKETTRNYDILAAVFSDALKFMHDDLGLV